MTQRVIQQAEVMMEKENIAKELNKAKEHLERAGDHA